MLRVDVKPEMLIWACERSGIDRGELARRIPQLPAWVGGFRKPTLNQLENFARATHTPVGYLFLPSPIKENIPIPDFRTMEGHPVASPSPDLLDTLHICQQRQEWYRDYARTSGELPLAFVNSARVGDDIVETARKIREAISFDPDVRRRAPTWTDALRQFIEQADNLGVLVMVSGVVGSNNTRKLDPREFRGFALSDDLAPLIFINGADTKAAQMFTLAHELAHIWTGQTGLSDVQLAGLPGDATEQWCNKVAAELLVPAGNFRKDYDRDADLDDEVNRLARIYKVSTLVILRRMFDVGGITKIEFNEAYEREMAHLVSIQGGSGGNFYLTLAARASKRFARALVTSTLEGRSSFTEAFRLLGFKKMSTFNDLGNSLGIGI